MGETLAAGAFQLPPRMVVGASSVSPVPPCTGGLASTENSSDIGESSTSEPQRADSDEAATSQKSHASKEVSGPDKHHTESDRVCADSSSTGTSSKKGQPWTESEHLAFISGLKKLGKGNWRGISRYYVPTRTPTQVASHAQKHFMRLNGVTKRKSRFSVLEQAAASQGLLNNIQKASAQPAAVAHAPMSATVIAASPFVSPFAASIPFQPAHPVYHIVPGVMPGQHLAVMAPPGITFIDGSAMMAASMPPMTFRIEDPCRSLAMAGFVPIAAPQVFPTVAISRAMPAAVPPICSSPVAVLNSCTPTPAAPQPAPCVSSPVVAAASSPPSSSPPAPPQPSGASVTISTSPMAVTVNPTRQISKPAVPKCIFRPTANLPDTKQHLGHTVGSVNSSSSLWAGEPSSRSAFRNPKVH